MNNVEAIKHLLYLWDEKRAWAEELLCKEFELDKASDFLQLRQEPGPLGERWYFRRHGNGVDITNLEKKGGIDFDFQPRQPDEWRLRDFMLKQLQEGLLTKKFFRPLLLERERFENAYKEAVTHNQPTHPLLLDVLARIQPLLSDSPNIQPIYFEGKVKRLVWSRLSSHGYRHLECSLYEENGLCELELFYCVNVPGLFAYEQRERCITDDVFHRFKAFLIELIPIQNQSDFAQLVSINPS